MSESKLEHRLFPAMEMRATKKEDQTTIEGYAAVFNKLSQTLYWGFKERIAPGAFTNSLEYDIRALWNHDTNFPLGRTKNNTLRLKEDDTGLAVEIEPPDTTLAKDFVESIRRGDVDQMSFGFITIEDSWDIEEDGTYVRTLIKVRLYEVSPVTFPAYTDTSIAVRSNYIPIKPTLRNDGNIEEAVIIERMGRERLLQLGQV